MLVAFGGAQSWTFAPAIIALAISVVLVRPPVATGQSRALDIALLCCLAWTVLQTVPLPPGWRDILSPNADAIDRALRFDGNVPRPRPLSIDPLRTLRAAIVTTMVAAMFWIARELCARQGARRLVQAVAWSGLAISVIALLTRAYSPDLIYGIWNPESLSQPYGPFVNRNHMGTWLVMALPLVMGYIFARFDDRARRGSFAAAIDTRMVWLMGSAGMMFVAVIISLSRSAAVGTLSAGMFAAASAVDAPFRRLAGRARRRSGLRLDSRRHSALRRSRSAIRGSRSTRDVDGMVPRAYLAGNPSDHPRLPIDRHRSRNVPDCHARLSTERPPAVFQPGAQSISAVCGRGGPVPDRSADVCRRAVRTCSRATPAQRPDGDGVGSDRCRCGHSRRARSEYLGNRTTSSREWAALCRALRDRRSRGALQTEADQRTAG